MLAAVTMVYNEPEFIPLWIKYYGEQVGKENCYIVDNGSDDGSLDDYKDEVNIIRVPREYKDNQQRTKFLSEFCSSLLNYFSHVIHVDVDEFIVANPAKYQGLKDYTSNWVKNRKSVTAIGLNVTQLPSEEQTIDFSKPILSQRSYVRFVSPMCKPCIIAKPITWSPGFHGSTHETVFDDIYMFHMRYFDLQYGLTRLERTRSMKWKSEKDGQHQRVEDETWKKWFVSFEKFLRKGLFYSDGSMNETLVTYLDQLREGSSIDSTGRTKPPMLTPNTLFEIPESFKKLV